MVKFKVKTPDKNKLKKEINEALEKQLIEKLKGVECPDHHQRPKLVNSGSATSPQYKIEGCCQKLIDQATRVLN